MASARMVFRVVCLFSGRDPLPKKPKPNPLQEKPLLAVWNAFPAWRLASRASEVQESFGKRLTELQKAVTEPEGCQDEANMGRIYQRRSQRKISKLALNLLWLLICSLHSSRCVATTIRFKKKKWSEGSNNLSLPKVQSVGMCGRVIFTKCGARARKVEMGGRKGAGTWMRAQEDERTDVWRKRC